MSSRGPVFIDRERFVDLLQEVRREDGLPYEDPGTVYGDLSRLVVGWLARTPPEELEAAYVASGFKQHPNIKPLHRAARRWFERYHPELVDW